MSKVIDRLYQLKGYIIAALLPLVLLFSLQVMVLHTGVHHVPAPIHGLSAMIMRHIFLFVLFHILILSSVYVYLSHQIARIISTRKLFDSEQTRLLKVKFWFLGMVAVLECVFILQVFL